jgi:hypothetical protein
LFGVEVADQLVSKYFIGTSKHWPGATVFWQIDISGKVRTGKIMLYSPATGKRVKEPFNHISWAHKVTKNIRETLKEMMQKELEKLPDTLKELEPIQRLNILCKLIPFVLPKVESVNHELDEPS